MNDRAQEPHDALHKYHHEFCTPEDVWPWLLAVAQWVLTPYVGQHHCPGEGVADESTEEGNFGPENEEITSNYPGN